MRNQSLITLAAAGLLAAVSACGPAPTEADAGVVDAGTVDAGAADAGQMDAGTIDAGQMDSGMVDAGPEDAGPADAGQTDSGTVDAGDTDAGTPDAGASDAGDLDAGEIDAGPIDAGMSDAGTADAGAADASYPAPFPAPPQVLNTNGGMVLAQPNIVAIFFAGTNGGAGTDDPTSITQITSFYQGIGGSQYWSALDEYGIGMATVTPVMLAQSAPATVDDSRLGGQLDTWLKGLITNNTGGTPSNAVGQTLYVINYPPGTTITQGGAQSCVDFGGYHSDMELSTGNTVAYAVVPRCSGSSMGFATDLDAFTASASHEVVEGVTDPYPDTKGAFAQADDAHLFWDVANSGSELGDMCENDPEAYTKFSDFPFMVQRFWSNTAGLAGHDPCVPELADTGFFNTVPELNDTGLLNFDPSNPAAGYTVDSIKIAAGQSGTLTLDLYSDQPTSGPWSVQLFDYSTAMGGSRLLSFSPVSLSGQNGDRLQTTITVDQASNGGLQPANTELFLVVSCMGTASQCNSNNPPPTHLWWGVVTN